MKKVILFLALGIICLNFASASQVLFHISPGITGSISKLSVEDLGNGKNIIASTSTGLFILDSNGNLVSSFSVPYPITDSVTGDDISSDGVKDVIISTTDQQFPNVMSISSKTGQMLWSFKPQIPSYDSQLMWTTRETKTWDLEPAADSNGDGIKDILVASGNTLYLLSGKNGAAIWNFSATNDIWKVKFSDNSIFFGSQDGILYSLDLNGKLIWENELVPSFTVKDVSQKELGKVKRSVWDILPNDKAIFVSAEDGNIYQIDKSSGKVLNQKAVIEYDEVLLNQYYGANNNQLVQTGPAMTNYFNINLFKTDSSTLGATTFLGKSGSGNNNKESGTYTVTARKIIFFDINSLQEITHSSEIPLADARQIFSSNGKFYIPLGKSDDTELFKSIDKAGATKLFEINTTIAQNYGGKSTSDSYFTEGFDDSSFIYASNTGDILSISYTNGVEWSFPRYNQLVTDALDFNGDGVLDFFVKSLKKDNPEDAMDEGKSRMIFLIDGKTLKQVWSYSINYTENIKSGGIQNVKVINDVNGDGYK